MILRRTIYLLRHLIYTHPVTYYSTIESANTVIIPSRGGTVFFAHVKHSLPVVVAMVSYVYTYSAMRNLCNLYYSTHSYPQCCIYCLHFL